MYVGNLHMDGFVSVQYPTPLRSVVEQTMKAWEAFCALSIEKKMLLSGGDRTHDVGYKSRSSHDGDDEKEFFHLVGTTMPQLRVGAFQLLPNLEGARLLDCLADLQEAIAPMVTEFARAVEERYRCDGLTEAVATSQDHWTFRLLHYRDTGLLARPHVDRGGFTMHLFEDVGGGQYLNFDGVWCPWPITSDSTIIFPSMGLQHLSGSRLKALCHQVRNEQARDRYAMVAFIDFHCSDHYNQQLGRLQDFEPGFNYAMTPEAFDQLFV